MSTEKVVTPQQFNGSDYDKIVFNSATSDVLSKFGLSSGGSNDILSQIGDLNKYVWRRRQRYWTATSTDVSSGTSLVSVSDSETRLPFYFSSTYTIGSDGTISLNSPVSYNYYVYSSAQIAARAPTYMRINNQSTIYYLPSGTTGADRSGSSSCTLYYTLNMKDLLHGYATVKVQKLSSSEIIGEWETLTSFNENAYPKNGMLDGYEYEFLGAPLKQINIFSKIITGSYIRTGNYGSSNPNNLVFDFTPRFVAVFVNEVVPANNYGAWGECFLWAYGAKYFTCQTYAGRNIVTQTGNLFSWYTTKTSDEPATIQCNRNGIEYKYVVLG